MRMPVAIGAIVAFTGAAACATLVGANFEQAHLRESAPALLAHIKAPSGQQSSAQFGNMLAMSADALVVTAPFQDLQVDAATLSRAGAAYVADPSNPSAPLVPLVAPNVDAFDGAIPGGLIAKGWVAAIGPWGGLRGAVNENVIAVGVAPEGSATTDPSDNSAACAGAVYAYSRMALGSPPQYIKAPVPQAGALFGAAVALSPTRLVVGAPGEDGAATDSGAVYVYDWRDGHFDDAHVIRLVPDVAHEDDYFGMAVAIDGDLLVVGAPGEGSPSTGFDGDPQGTSSKASGAAYLYRLAGDQWVAEHYLKPAVIQSGTFFGFSLSASNGRFAIGAPAALACSSDSGPPVHGAVYVVGSSGNAWAFEQCLSAGPSTDDLFGWSVSLLGDDLLVGAPWDASGHPNDPQDTSRPFSGAVHWYRRNTAGSWSARAYLKAPDPQANDVFGFSVALAPGRIAVGAPFEAGGPHDADPSHYSGALYLFGTDGPGVDGASP